MYWADRNPGKIQRASLEIPVGESATDRTDIETLITTVIDTPNGIALNLLTRKIYWADRLDLKIQRANMDIPEGEQPHTRTDIEDVITEGITPIGIALELPPAGIPAISIPCGFSQDGLPIGLQIMAKRFDEEAVFRAAHAYEQDTPWHAMRPPVGNQ